MRSFLSWGALLCLVNWFIAPPLAQAGDIKKGFVSWQPAASWEDALLTGNGTMGALVMGDPFEETIILNHALIYLPNEAPVRPPSMVEHLEEIRQLSLDGEWGKVARLGVDLWEKEGYGPKKWTDPFVPAANLKMELPASNIEHYERSVNYETAEAIVAWTDQRGSFERSTFMSRPDSVMVTRIKGNAPVSLSLRLEKHPHSWEQSAFMNEALKENYSEDYNNEYLRYHSTFGKAHQYSPAGYDALLRVETKGGSKRLEGSVMHIENAEEVLIFTDIAPYFAGETSQVANIAEKLAALPADFTHLKERQFSLHGEMYNRMQLDLFPSENETAMTSETLVLNALKNTTPGIIQRQFEAARYNILCAAGTNPPNLQGIWSGTWTPAWCSDFTHDGNVEVAVSHYLNGNMPELLLSYFDYHERLIEQYKINAKQFYGASGIHIPSHTSTHGLNNHYDETWCMEYWNAGGGWTASFFYDYYLYTGDLKFLKERAFPFISEALAFWEDFLIIGEDGKYLVNPSYSPENNPLEHQWQNCINATMDIVVVKELLNNWIAAAKKLGVSKKEIRAKEKMLTLLPEYQIATDGTIREWLWPDFSENQSHRHASHLYGLYEVPDQHLLDEGKLEAAARKTIEERMKIRKQYEGGEMAFGMCLLGNAAVRLKDLPNTEDIITYLSKFYWTKGMATTHNPRNLFNMDISGGFPSLITRMLINSAPGELTVLPTLPQSWNKGKVSGIQARNQIAVQEMSWEDDKGNLKFTSGQSQVLSVDMSSLKENARIDISGAKILERKDQKIALKVGAGQLVTIDWQ
ncbi:glycosyl hydrolase family 95 catalytic domain-containing protein [Persicobacter diffluens]|uniref:Glycosyl hydrolase family 95 N-terminal domain-containing protein n=1 Tax=Persicobacter diffluens TaxID=981 RepID=A0AAN5APB7_9BACT|nr:hypothetical protein PEDI_47330 [Persicobacter diffluens]